MKTKIEKLVFGGQALGRDEETGKVLFLWNALPGEEVEFEVTKKKRGIIEGVATKVLSASPDRVEPKEDSYLSTSPWQMMTMEAEDRYKVEIGKETYSRGISNKTAEGSFNELEIVSDPDMAFGYRNKMEFSFYTKDIDSPTQLCFFARGQHTKVPVEGSLLAEPVINEVANEILEWLNNEGVNRIDLKSLIIRSNGKGEAIAALFVTKGVEISEWHPLSDSLLGFHVFFSNPKSPASVPTELLYSSGASSLVMDVKTTSLQFGLLSFFQVHVPVFTKAVEDMATFLDPKLDIVDFYSGVGSISLPLSKYYRQAVLVESNEEATEFAQQNIADNQIDNAVAVLSTAEDAVEYISTDKILIVDPPRAGLHKKVIDRILFKKPKRVIYLSCNLSTQSRDVDLLLEGYSIVFSKLYNFFPRTPHMEGLVILERR
ncbi:class I SAM-dependent RNA methyltransferase [Candidatus Uhrbacteria bacterium]|nr:class I SAM-dependent RNA methyltransferase [Candidatus Uhrbacteria bacterium]